MMRVLTDGIAHVSFRGGGFFLPVRTPYDRQMLIEHVASRVRVKGRVQVLVDDRHWMIDLNHEASAPSCMSCGHMMDSACYCTRSAGQPYCVRCALGVDAATFEPARPELQRSVG